MKKCAECSVSIEGDWNECPLCGDSVSGEAVPSPFPDPPLSFSWRRVLKVLFVTSIAVILAAVVVQVVFRRWFAGIGDARYVWLGVITIWLVVIVAVRKRQNIAKVTLYWVVIVWLVTAYWDYFTGWEAWSVTYTVPIVAASALVAVLIVVRVMRIEVGEHIVYSWLTAVIGLVPVVFLATGLVTDPWPSIVCVALSAFTLIVIAVVRGRHVHYELEKRFDL